MFSLLGHLLLCVVYLAFPRSLLPDSKCLECPQVKKGPISGSLKQNQPGFLLFSGHCQAHSSCVKDTFLESWPQTVMWCLDLNHNYLNKQYYFFLEMLMGSRTRA